MRGIIEFNYFQYSCKFFANNFLIKMNFYVRNDIECIQMCQMSLYGIEFFFESP